MADEKKTPEAAEDKKRSLKGPIMVLGILIVEAGLIVGGMMMLMKPPAATEASLVPEVEAPEEEKIVEIPVLDAKLPNAKSGVTYLYDTEIYVQVKQRNAEEVQSQLERFQNEIKADLNAVWRTSEPKHFQEPRLESLTRKVHALMDERFGADAVSGEPIVRKCVIVMGTGFRVDH
jgi:hypothetical protein